MGKVTTTAYDIANSNPTKEPIIVMKIDGLPFILSSGTTYTNIRYDDPGVNYDGTYVYDGLRPIDADKQKNLIDRMGSSSTISQKLEQWDGKASIETFNIKLVDYNNIVTQICTPGYYFEDIMNRKVEIAFGFKEISYPEDYLVLFRGYVNKVKIAQGAAYFTFTDPSGKRKQVLFNGAITQLMSSISNSATALTVDSTTGFYQTILNPLGVKDDTVTIGLVLDGKEIVTFENADVTSSTNVNVVRGQYGTTAVAHDAGIDVKMFIALNDNPLNIALKAQLSGWNGPYYENIPIKSIVNTDNGDVENNSITLPTGLDFTRDYGATIGDFLRLRLSPNATNNTWFQISDFINEGRTALVIATIPLVQENPTTNTVMDIRSKYDVYPVAAGLKIGADDVLVSSWEENRDTFVPFAFDNLQIVGQESSGKTFIETHLLKSIGAYSLSQQARISVGITHPPLANDLTVFLDPTNTIQAKEISVERGLNDRFFYNEFVFNYDFDPLQEVYFRQFRFIDGDAQKRIKQVSVLTIDCRGLGDNDNSRDIMLARAKRLAQRYGFGAEVIMIKSNFETGHKVDAGDTMVLNDFDTPVLQIANTELGNRKISNRIMEVQERAVNISQAFSQITLLSNNGFSFSDRYAVIGPASELDETFTHTSTMLKIKDSWDHPKFPGAEYKKWEDYAGSTIRVHNDDYSLDAETTYQLDLSDPFIMLLTPALPFTPTDDMVVEFSKYDDTDENINATVKATFGHINSSAPIFSASSTSVFVLASGYSARYQIGMIVYVVSPDGSRKSPDVKITNIAGDVITIGPVFTGSATSDLGFIPQPDDIMELGGFKDVGAGYRLI